MFARRLGVPWLLLPALIGCVEVESRSVAPEMEVLVSGCAAIRDASVCEIDASSSQIRIWVRATAGAEVSIATGQQRSSLTAMGIDAGKLFHIDVAQGTKSISVIAAREGAESQVRIDLAPSSSPPALARAKELRTKHMLDLADSEVAAILRDADPRTQARAVGESARISLARGDVERSIRLFQDAIVQDRAAGLVSNEMDDRFALSHVLVVHKRDIAGARNVLNVNSSLVTLYPDALAGLPYYRGQLALEIGDLRGALLEFRASALHAERLGLSQLRLDALQEEGMTLSLLGRHDDAERLVREVQGSLDPGVSGCRRATVPTDLAWIALMAVEAGARGSSADTRATLDEALGLYKAECPRPRKFCNAYTNLALWAFQERRPEDARAFLANARQAQPAPDPEVRAWWSIIEGGMLLREARPKEALAEYEHLSDAGRVAMLPEIELRGVGGRAEALAALGRFEDAIAAYEQVEELLDRLVTSAPLGEGRDAFMQRYSMSRLYLDFLVNKRAMLREQQREAPASLGAVRAAAMVARRSHGRLLAASTHSAQIQSLASEERALWDETVARYQKARSAFVERAAEEWDLPRDELVVRAAMRRREHSELLAGIETAVAGIPRPRETRQPLWMPGSGDLLLVYHPVRDGWVAMAIGHDDAVIQRVGSLDIGAPKDQLANKLLLPFEPYIERARRVQISAFGPAAEVDFHALPFRGAPLLARAPIAYLADLPVPRGPVPSRISALILGDPRGDLPAAKREAGEVGDALARKGWAVTLWTGKEASYSAVQDALPQEDFLHYAGHGQTRGVDGWESQLFLAAEGTLRVADLLAVSRVPQYVVLSACHTISGDDFGLGQAFLAAGARAVVASARPVDDDLARKLMLALYASLRAAPEALDIPEALRAAQLSVARESPGSDWAAFRVLTP